jgi:hypothetical protein
MDAKKKPRRIIVAACAPASYGFAPEEYFSLIETVIAGKERDPGRILRHVDLMLDHQARNLERPGGRSRRRGPGGAFGGRAGPVLLGDP